MFMFMCVCMRVLCVLCVSVRAVDGVAAMCWRLLGCLVVFSTAACPKSRAPVRFVAT